jgi:hypothetical protein
VVRWPKKDANDRWDYDPKRNTLVVACTESGMLELGEVDGPGFDLEATFIQTPWTGGAGVYFRGRNEPPKAWRGQTFVVADVVALDRITGQGAADPAQLGYAEVQKFVAPPNTMFNQFLQSGPVPRPLGETHRLSVTVGKTGLEMAKWDDLHVPAVCEAAAKGTPRTGAGGTVGVWVKFSTTQFQSVRVRLHPVPGGSQ